ncbi:MAG: DUF2330 domain-containing protein [Candidatus Aminicenantes bacterium]|nr:DUF2330 domain-containing protein [Candidatus Aminicenantes bacterium]
MNRASNSFFLSPVFILLILASSWSFNVNADRGSIYYSPENVRVSEDAQKAIILHNLEEEVLILGMDLKADKKIGIVTFIPFPSEPQVSLAPDQAFENAAAMIKKYGLKYLVASGATKGGPATTAAEGVEIHLNKKLGAHDLTVIKVNDVSTFRKWVNDFFKSKGLPLKEAYPEEEAVVDDYVKRGIIYFVLDFVEVLAETRFIEPVIYKFKSKELYYPLKTSNTFGGSGSIELIILAPTNLFVPGDSLFYLGGLDAEGDSGFSFLPMQASTSARISKDDENIKGIYPEGENFFKGHAAFIQVVRFIGKYDFKNDIFIDASKDLLHGAVEGGQK